MKNILAPLLVVLIAYTTTSTIYGATVKDCKGYKVNACAQKNLLQKEGRCNIHYIVDASDCQARYCNGENFNCSPTGKKCTPTPTCSPSKIFY